MTHYHNNYALVQCIDPTTYKVRQEDPQQLEVDGEWIDLLPFWRWERMEDMAEEHYDLMVDKMYPADDDDCVAYKNYQTGICDHFYAESSFLSLLRSLNLDPARCLVFKQMEK